MVVGSASGSLLTPESFHTAHDLSFAESSTAATTPDHNAAETYRKTRPLPLELRQQCQILLEEQLYDAALSLLRGVFAAGTSSQRPDGRGACIPPPSHLALIATLTVHPNYTSRAEDTSQQNVAASALEYLRGLMSAAGPICPNFGTAFQFVQSGRGGRWTARRREVNGTTELSDSDGDRPEDRLSGKLVDEGSIWSRGQSFWNAVGWAFNCSALYPHRWIFWKPWLEFMLDLLEADWSQREQADLVAHDANGANAPVKTEHRRQSIIYTYARQNKGREAGPKATMRAIFADGSSNALALFQEIFEKELRGRQKRPTKRKREELDLENGKFGDYFDDDPISSGISEPPTPQKPRYNKKTSFGTQQARLAESVELRLRLFKLISAMTLVLDKTTNLNRLYDEFATTIKVLPLDVFSTIVSQRPNALLAETHATIIRELFRMLLPPTYKDPFTVDEAASREGALTSRLLEQCYAEHAANTVATEDNAKLSLVVESALQLLWSADALEGSDALVAAVEKGISAREAKVKRKRTSKARTDDSEDFALDLLQNSAERVRLLLEFL